ncbi:Gnt-I system high-affinity gluconate transporter [Chitinophaga niastensis]|uniref:Gnt-I system high-affinity gluconate transporter n=1 Tax=Chitinophaga niastensis TaxID=536980 RepID=A0A2P8HEX4_CHINA|nr:gluconate:H+ symporter [Chitinophaga niastensis]PSL44769.1 Gnt-I system high-affinity gluconate transporter [Chitinophaga niastensis]
MAFFIVFSCMLVLILLLTWGKMNAFIAFLIVSILTGLLLGIPADKISTSLQKGIGDTLGGLLIIIILGAMLGKLVAESGAARQIANALMHVFGPRYVQWALLIAGFIIGIPLYYGVGFVLMVPLIFSVVYQYKLPAVYIGLPTLAALSVTHGFLPPHPSPTALVAQFHANMGLTLIYGLAVAIPTLVIAGPFFARYLKHIPSTPASLFQVNEVNETVLPGKSNSFITALLPVFLLIITAVLPYVFTGAGTSFKCWLAFAGDAPVVMLFSLLVATFSLGILQHKAVKEIMRIYADAVKDVAMILLIIGGAGALKQVLADSGVSLQIAAAMQSWHIPLLVLGWLTAAIIRGCVGSATIAGITAAGMIAPLMLQGQVNPNLMVLSVGAGSLMFSHVNDAGFWMFKEYFNLSIKHALLSWSVMETIVGVVGLLGVLVLDKIV